MPEKIIVAAAQVAPAFLDLKTSLEIAAHWIYEAGKKGVRLLVFPETWLTGYPIWLDQCPGAALWDNPQAKAIFRRLFENSPEVPSAEISQLSMFAQEAGVIVVMGLHERDGNSLYNSMVYISDKGEYLGKHRKLMPTYGERMVWGQGDGSTLTVVDTPIGRLGGLVCWEHWMPLTRYAMHAKREVFHAAVWPGVIDNHLLASRSYAFEGRCFVIAAGATLWRKHLPSDLELLNQVTHDGPYLEGCSAIIGPDGEVIAALDGETEGLLTAEVDPGRIAEEALTFDVCGHYSRLDVFRLFVNEKPGEKIMPFEV